MSHRLEACATLLDVIHEHRASYTEQLLNKIGKHWNNAAVLSQDLWPVS
ncbi:hypothetical protein [Moorena sp. SIO4G3]|nr:hypothetical protein [Moorena sp. SIO4G3]NEO77896.1 hypothetical protein [Moorena sp. SIO4G3]